MNVQYLTDDEHNELAADRKAKAATATAERDRQQ